MQNRELSWLAVLAPAGGIFVGTFDVAAIAVSLPALKALWRLSTFEVGLLASVALVGMVVGGLVAGVLADRYGRRGILLANFATYGLAALGSAVAPNPLIFAICRFLVGLGVGADYAVAFPYLAEQLRATRRGKTMATVMWAANFGMLAAYALGAMLVVTPQGWRELLAVGGLLAFPLLALRSALPESSAWLRQRRARPAEAGTWDALRTMWRPRERRSLAVAATNWFCYQVSDQGLTLFLPLFLAALLGQTAAHAAWASAGVKAVTVPAAFATIFLIEKIGRRPLQIWGFLGRGVSLVILGLMMVSAPGHDLAVKVSLLVAAYAIGAAGPDKTTVITPAELFETADRATGQAVAESVGRVGGIVGTVGYGLLATMGGPGLGLLFFGVLALAGFVVSAIGLPETRGKSVTDGGPDQLLEVSS